MKSTRRAIVGNIATGTAVGAAYFGACWIGLSLDVTAGVGSVWPASGLLMGLLLLAERRQWAAIGVGAFIGGVAANLGVGFGLVASIGFVLINLAESFGGNWLVRRFTPDAVRLRQPSDVLALIGYCALVATAPGAPVAATLASLVAHADFWTVLRTWWTADASGVVTIMPVVLATAALRTRAQGRWSALRSVEALTILAAVVALSWWIFLVPHEAALGPFTQPFPLMPVMVWGAIRFGLAGAAWPVVLINGFCIWGTQSGLGPYAGAGSTLDAHLVVQTFVSVTSVVSLLLAAAVGSANRSALVHRELVLKLQTAAEGERARLSHELHDDIAQKLAALKMHLELEQLLGQPRVARAADGSVERVDGLIADVRELSHSLRPAPFEEGQLIPALTALAKTEGRRAGLCVLVDTPTLDAPLSRDAELACYRVVREAVINIVKHARARHVGVSALRHAHFFAIRVVDDGKGFDVGPAARQALLDGHLGLVGMQERLDQVGGTLKIRSQRGGGTMVECRVPLMVTL